MNPDQAEQALSHAEQQMQANAHPSPELLVSSAKTAAAGVRAAASRNGAQIAIRVKATESGVRVTVSGPRAGLYRDMMRRALADQIPSTLVELRAQITR